MMIVLVRVTRVKIRAHVIVLAKHRTTYANVYRISGVATANFKPASYHAKRIYATRVPPANLMPRKI